jgi:uncharacterized membrane protein YadS
VKLARTLWIVPVSLAIGLAGRENPTAAAAGTPARAERTRVAVPWFIGLFVVASVLGSYVPAVAAWGPALTAVGRRGLVLVLFLAGSSLSVAAVRRVGWKPLAVGAALWGFISVGSVAAILGLGLAA